MAKEAPHANQVNVDLCEDGHVVIGLYDRHGKLLADAHLDPREALGVADGVMDAIEKSRELNTKKSGDA